MTSIDSQGDSKPGPPGYLMAREGFGGDNEDIDLRGIVALILDSKWFVILVTSIFLIAGLAYAFLATERYRAEAILIPAESRAAGGLMTQFGGLAQLAGLNLGNADSAEQLAVLKSNGFARSFIEEEDLLKVIFEDEWDESKNKWKGNRKDWPDVRDAVRVFDKKIRYVAHDRKTGIVTLAVEWKDPETAAAWANAMARRVNEQVRGRAVAEAERNIAFLRAELSRTDLVELQQAVGRLLEFELQKLMLARGNSQYAFRIVDWAQVPKKRVWPKRTLIVTASVGAGMFIAILLLILRDSWRSREIAESPRGGSSGGQGA